MIRELDLTQATLNTSTTKDIADGLMRAKQLEILKVGGNAMGASVNSIIYNLAFSPKIRFIDLSDMTSTNADTAEALYKLLNISGSIETLVLSNSDVISKLSEEFYKAVGMNKTLHTLDMLITSTMTANVAMMGKAVAMNAKKNGSLKCLKLQGWFTNYAKLNQFCEALKITEQDHEYWYGDRNVASKMVKEDAHNRVMHFKLDYLTMGGAKANFAGIPFKPKVIEA